MKLLQNIKIYFEVLRTILRTSDGARKLNYWNPVGHNEILFTTRWISRIEHDEWEYEEEISGIRYEALRCRRLFPRILCFSS